MKTVVVLLCLLSASCLSRPTEIPIPSLSFNADPQHRTLLVMLPGAGDRPQDFLKNGFYKTLQDSKIAADVRVVDSHVEYFRDGYIVERLHDDIVLPAIKDGYREIWFAGISLGGLGSLMYARAHPDRVSGVLLLAPYLGPPRLIDEIESAGGIRAWKSPTSPEAQDFEGMWAWLQRHAGNPTPVIYLAYGLQDRFSRAHAQLATLLPKEHVLRAPGGHDWATWKKLWPQLLDSMVSPR